MLPSVRHICQVIKNITSRCLQQQNKNVMELSGTGVPPSLLGEVQERRSGVCKGAGAAFRLVPAEIKHCVLENFQKNSVHMPLVYSLPCALLPVLFL